MNRESLKLEVMAAFKSVTKPSLEDIAPHQCLECDELRVALDPYESLNIPTEVLDKCRWDMPLLSDDAKQYFLPAWLLRSIDEPRSDYTSALLFALDDDHRWAPSVPYSDRQWRVLVAYLDFMASTIDEYELPRVENAKLRIETRPNKSLERTRGG